MAGSQGRTSQGIGNGAQNDDCDREGREMLLEGEIPVDSDEYVKRLDRHPNAGKDRGAPHHFGAAGNDWLAHAVRLLPTPRRVQRGG